ncbi:hypothetical protein JCM19039_1996 [Geomicrobium sp. JCM 19039]|nr:hypothetical protein JCM19039_1996 [Geomicrobium sp. JCM 19039]
MLPDLYPQIVTIINPDGDSVDEWGQPIKGEEVIFEGLECNVAPAGGDEVRNGSTSYGLHTHMITIPGLYDIQAGWFADVEDDGKYAILLSEQDSQRSQTRIRAEGREI